MLFRSMRSASLRRLPDELVLDTDMLGGILQEVMPQSQLMSESKSFDLVSRDIGALPIVNHFLERLELTALLAKHLPGADSRAKVQPVEAIGVLVRNLVLSRVPLYSQAEWAHRTEASLLDLDRKSTRLNSSHIQKSRMPSSA